MRHINIDLNNLEPCYKIGRMFEANVVTLNITLPIEFNKNADYYLLEFENSNKETVNTEPLSLDGNVIVYEMPEELTQKGCLNAVLSSYKARDGDTVEIEKSDIINLKFSRSIKSDSVITPAIQGFIEKIVLLIENGKIKGDKGDPGEQGPKGDQGEQGIPGRDAYQFFEIMSTGRDLISISEGVYLAISDLTIKNRNSTAKKDLLIYKNTFFSVEVGVLSNTHELTFYGECEFDGEKKPYSSYRLSTNGGYLVDVTTYNSLLNKINELQSDTTDSFQGKQDKLTAGAGIKIDNNVISADTQFSLIKASGKAEAGYLYPVPDIANPKSNAIYLVPIENPETDDDYHYEWLWDDSYQSGAWELLGTTSLSAIPKKTSQLENDSDFVSDADYVHTDNNYTTADKNKLASLSNYNDTDIKKSIAEKQDKFTTSSDLKLENNILSLAFSKEELKGDKGDTGAQGPQGLKGDTGPQGVKGDKGDPGTVFTTGTGLILENGVLSLNIPTADSSTVYGGTV